MAKPHFTERFDNFGISKLANYLKLAPDRKHHFEELLYESISKEEVVRKLNDIRAAGGLKLHFKTGLGAINTPTNTFLAKSAFYANKTLITYPFVNIEDKRELQEFKGKRRSTREINTAHRIYLKGVPGSFSFYKKGKEYKLDGEAFKEFLDLLIRHRPAIESGVADILPLFPDTEKKLRDKKLGLISANFKLHELREQFFEIPDLGINKRESSSIVPKLWLPHFSNIHIDRVLEIREKEKDLHNEFQRRLEALLLNASETVSESKILNYMHEVDMGVRELDRKFKEIQTNYRRKNIYLTIRFLLAGLVMMAPSDHPVTDLVGKFMGGATLFQFITAREEFRQQESSLRSERFYLHWLVFRDKAKG